MDGLGEELQAEVEAIQSFLIEGEGEEVKVGPSHAKMAVHTIGNLPTPAFGSLTLDRAVFHQFSMCVLAAL